MTSRWYQFVASSPAILLNRSLLAEDATPCRTAVEGCIKAYDRWESRVHAWVSFDQEGALHQAEILDREFQDGESRGPLHGFPLGIKDIIDVEGLPTSAGASQWAQGRAASDAPMVAKLREAGAIILGKTVTTPYAWTDPPTTRNPWKLERTPGGSSSGSAVAVATGMALGAIGTQTGGSIIRPAAYCGVVGWKPSRVMSPSTKGIVPFSPTLDTPGLLAGHLYAIRLFQAALGHPFDESELPFFPPDDSGFSATWNSAHGGTRSAPRLGRLRGFFEELADGEMIDTLDRAVDCWRADGCQVEDVDLPPVFAHVRQAHRVVMSYEAAKVHGERFTRIPEDYPPNMTALLREGAGYSESDYREAKQVGAQIEGFNPDPFDAFVMPAATGPAPSQVTTGDPVFNSPWTFGGQPALSFPLGRSLDGLPFAAQFVGTPGREGDLLAAALWCSHQATELGWKPPSELLDATWSATPLL